MTWLWRVAAGILPALVAVTSAVTVTATPLAVAIAEAPPRLDVTITLSLDGAAPGLRLAVLARNLAAGPVIWRPATPTPPEAPPLGQPRTVRLTGPLGLEVAADVTTEGIMAEVPAGDWLLSYELPLKTGAEAATDTGAGAESGAATGSVPASGFLIRPSRLGLFPDGIALGGPPVFARVRVTLTAPDGWDCVPNVPCPDAGIEVTRLRWLCLLVSPGLRAPATSLPVGGATVRVYVAGAGEDETALAAAGDAAAAFGLVLTTPQGSEANVFLGPDADPGQVARETLDTLWLLSGRTAAGDATADRWLTEGLWALARHSLLTAAGLAGEAALARELWRESEAYRRLGEEQTGPPTPPLEGAPLVSAYLLARALAITPEVLLQRACSVLDGGSTAGADGATAGLLEALAKAGGPDAGELLTCLARSGRLPGLPEEVLALADPDTDGDGLPDRIDPFPRLKGVSVVVDGRTVRWDVPPAVMDGRIMVPVRFLAESLGLDASWDAEERRVLVRQDQDVIVFPLGSPSYVLGGVTHWTDAPARVVGERTLAPLRFVAQALNVFLAWDGSTLTAAIDRGLPYPVGPERPSPSDRVVYLTFDDGPNPSMTPRILDTLAQGQARATFFVMGCVAARYPDLLRRIAREGHALGNHTYSHDLDENSPGWIYRCPAAYVEELDACDRTIAEATELHPVVTRPPGGSEPYLTEAFRQALRDGGYVSHGWDVSAADSAVPRPTVEQILARIRVCADEPGRTRLIILMHDGGSDHETTLQALPAVIDYLKSAGYTFGVLTG